MTRSHAQPTPPLTSVAAPGPIGAAGSHAGAPGQKATRGHCLVPGVVGRGRTGDRRRADILASTKETR
jgi:hypothetical protein